MHPSSQLSPRLNGILEIVKWTQQNNNYSCVWDCCCDHGYLGIKILHEQLCEKLYFVDQLPHIMTELSNKLMPFNLQGYEVITADAGKLSFDMGLKNLVILAGVGGETSVEIVCEIESNHPNTQIDYIFCPSSGHKELRKYLIEQKLGVIVEKLILENKRYYEILFMQGKSSACHLESVSPVCELWEADNEDHQRYLKKISTPRQSKKPKRKKLIK